MCYCKALQIFNQAWTNLKSDILELTTLQADQEICPHRKAISF
jgi:hypothetical protein